MSNPEPEEQRVQGELSQPLASSLGPRPRSGRFRLPLLLVLALTAGLNTLWFGFAYDDDLWIVFNPLVRSLRHVPEFFRAGQVGNRTYRPLTALSFALDYAAAGLHPWLYHLENVLLHVLVTLLGYLLLKRVAPRAAWLAALLFAVLPVHTEAVANITARSELLAAAFGLLALLLLERPLLAGAAMFAAILSKESGAAVLALAVLLYWRASDFGGLHRLAQGWKENRAALMRLLAALAVFTIAVGAYLLLRRQAGCCVQFPGSNLLNAQLDNPLYTVGWASRIPTALVVLAQNLALCVFPYRLAADYSYAQTQVVGWASASFLAWGVVLAAAIAGAILVRRRWPGITFGVLWFLLALLPASNLVIAIGTVRAERLLYLPSLGICLAVAELLLMVVRARPRAGMALIVVLLGSFAVASLGRNIVWRDMKTIVAATVRDSPRSARAHYNQAVIYARAGDYARAIPGFQTAINLYPQFELARLKLGDCYRDTGDLRAAEENYRLVFEQDRRNPEAAGSLAAICEQLGDAACVEEARRALTRFQQ